MEIHYIPISKINEEWDEYSKEIDSALVKGDASLSLDYMKARLNDDSYRAFRFIIDDEPVGLMIISMFFMDSNKLCDVITYSGSLNEEIEVEGAKFIYDVAKIEGCKEVRVYGRKGWIRKIADKYKDKKVQIDLRARIKVEYDEETENGQ